MIWAILAVGIMLYIGLLNLSMDIRKAIESAAEKVAAEIRSAQR